MSVCQYISIIAIVIIIMIPVRIRTNVFCYRSDTNPLRVARFGSSAHLFATFLPQLHLPSDGPGRLQEGGQEEGDPKGGDPISSYRVARALEFERVKSVA